jgi:hypothetical protein
MLSPGCRTSAHGVFLETLSTVFTAEYVKVLREFADKLAREGSVQQFVGSEPNLGRDNRHMARWRRLISTQRQARKLISGPGLTVKTRLLSFDRTRAVTDLLTGNNTLRRHHYLKGQINSPLRRGWGAEEETSAHVLYEFEVLATPSIFGPLFLEPRGCYKSKPEGNPEL